MYLSKASFLCLDNGPGLYGTPGALSRTSRDPGRIFGSWGCFEGFKHLKEENRGMKKTNQELKEQVSSVVGRLIDRFGATETLEMIKVTRGFLRRPISEGKFSWEVHYSCSLSEIVGAAEFDDAVYKMYNMKTCDWTFTNHLWTTMILCKYLKY